MHTTRRLACIFCLAVFGCVLNTEPCRRMAAQGSGGRQGRVGGGAHISKSMVKVAMQRPHDCCCLDNTVFTLLMLTSF